jgi:predicted HTH domain antitoxin
MTKDIILTIPLSLAQEMKLPPDTIREELMSELAVSLYQQWIITAAQACRLSGLDRFQFEELLGKRQIPIHYSEEDLDQDIRYATGNL